MSRSLAAMLAGTAAAHGARPALRLDDVVVDYDGLHRAAGRVAAALRRRGVAPGDRVGIMVPNVPAFAMAYYGVLRAGAVVVPINVMLTAGEVAAMLGDCGARLVIAWPDLVAAAAPGAAQAGAEVLELGPDGAGDAAADDDVDAGGATAGDLAVLLYTSGTTGRPKGAELTHDNLVRNAEVSADLHGLSADDVILGALPLFHAFGQTCSLNAGVRRGACLTLLPRFAPARAVGVIERDRVTVVMGVPTMYVALAQDASHRTADLSSLRLCVSGGASLPGEVLRGFEEAFDCHILEGYGLSETSPVAAFNHPGRERKVGSIGTPIAGVEMRVVGDGDVPLPAGEIGEIVVRGHNVMRGYWNRPDETALALRGGWLHTGDLARVDDDGYFFIVDRKKDLIIRAGFNVYPREVEEVLFAHPAVLEAAVLGVPDPQVGEEVGAAVVLREGAHLDAQEVTAFCRERLAAYKVPRVVWFPGALPKGATGKVLKRDIEIPQPISDR